MPSNAQPPESIGLLVRARHPAPAASPGAGRRARLPLVPHAAAAVAVDGDDSSGDVRGFIGG